MPRNSKKVPLTRRQKVTRVLKKPIIAVKANADEFLSRRPHRSFRLSRRREYNRSLKLPGYISFTNLVNKTLWRHRKIFILLAIFYAVLTAVFVGIASQETYNSLTSTLSSVTTEVFQGNIGQLGEAVLIFASIGSGVLAGTPTISQQIFIILFGLLIWLTTIWLLRNLLAGHKVKLRDGLYNAGSPIIATLFVAVVFALQLIPIGIAAVGYTAAEATGLLTGGVESMLFWAAATLLTVISLYLVTATFFAMIIVTLPGTYPGRALRTAGYMVSSRRFRILLRILWMLGTIAVAGIVVIIPAILINAGLTNLWPVIQSVPVVPTVLMLFSVVAFIWSASYIYLLYRKVVDDDAKPV